MMKTIKYSIFVLSLFFAFNSFAQDNLSLLASVEKALENNYDIRIQRMDNDIASLNNNWGTAGRYPSLSLSVNSNNKADFNELENYTQNQLIGGVNLSWVLFDGFKVNITKQKLEELEKLSKGYTAVLVEGTIEAVILAYNNLLLQKKILSVYIDNEQLSKDRFDYEKMQQEFGNAVSYEVLQSQNAYLADQSDVLLQMANVKAAQRELAYLMGEDEFNYRLTDTMQVTFEQFDFEALQEIMLSNNKTLQNQYVNQTLLEKDIATAKATFMPRLSMSAGGQTSSLSQNYIASPDYNAASSNVFGNFTLSYNLFNGGVRKRAVQIARIEEEIGSIQVEEMKVSLSNQLSNLLDFYEARQKMVDLANERLKVAKINLDISGEKLKAGTINSFNYRDVQLSYQSAAIAQLNAMYNYLQVKTSLQRITGNIIQED